MSTRCNIGYQKADGTFYMIYCHYDGYPKYVGKILVEHYSDSKKVDALLDGPLIRNFDPSGAVARFNEEDESGARIFSTLEEAASGFDYVYVFTGGNWQCVTHAGALRLEQVKIPA